MPVVHFGYWRETLRKWADEGHLTREEADRWGDGNRTDDVIAQKLGFDFGWGATLGQHTSLMPSFETKVIRDLGGGRRHVQNGDGVTVLESDGAVSIQAEISHLLVDRRSWEEHYLPRMRFSEERVNYEAIGRHKNTAYADRPTGLHIGSLYGTLRNWIGMEGLSYLQYDDEELYREIIDTMGNLCYEVTKRTLDTGVTFDFAHFWEDICFNSGPLVSPAVFAEKIGPHYRRITSLLMEHGVDIVSLDCDGCIDALVPVWLENGVNTMFPIEVGTWNASIAPWREKYGPDIRGIGGMNKTVFARDYAAVDAEIERLKPLVALGGYIPCPDHRIAPDAKWENVQYYTQEMRKAFG